MLRENKRVRENLDSENIRGAKIKGIKVSKKNKFLSILGTEK